MIYKIAKQLCGCYRGKKNRDEPHPPFFLIWSIFLLQLWSLPSLFLFCNVHSLEVRGLQLVANHEQTRSRSVGLQAISQLEKAIELAESIGRANSDGIWRKRGEFFLKFYPPSSKNCILSSNKKKIMLTWYMPSEIYKKLFSLQKDCDFTPKITPTLLFYCKTALFNLARAHHLLGHLQVRGESFPISISPSMMQSEGGRIPLNPIPLFFFSFPFDSRRAVTVSDVR